MWWSDDGEAGFERGSRGGTKGETQGVRGATRGREAVRLVGDGGGGDSGRWVALVGGMSSPRRREVGRAEGERESRG